MREEPADRMRLSAAPVATVPRPDADELRLPRDPFPADRVLHSDPHDFAGLYVRHRSSFTLHARRYLHDPRDADEVVQEAFLRLFLALPELETELQALAYCRRTITNLCIDRYRAQARRPRLVDLESVPADDLADADPGDPVVRAEDAAIVRNALSMLSPLHRAALVKREIEEKPLPVIAGELEIPEDSVKHVLFRARRALRRLLAATSVAPGADGERTGVARAGSAGLASLMLLLVLGLGSGPDLEAIPVVGRDLPDLPSVTDVARAVGDAVSDVSRAVTSSVSSPEGAGPAGTGPAGQGPGQQASLTGEGTASGASAGLPQVGSAGDRRPARDDALPGASGAAPVPGAPGADGRTGLTGATGTSGADGAAAPQVPAGTPAPVDARPASPAAVDAATPPITAPGRPTAGQGPGTPSSGGGSGTPAGAPPVAPPAPAVPGGPDGAVDRPAPARPQAGAVDPPAPARPEVSEGRGEGATPPRGAGASAGRGPDGGAAKAAPGKARATQASGGKAGGRKARAAAAAAAEAQAEAARRAAAAAAAAQVPAAAGSTDAAVADRLSDPSPTP